jgi:hypothetical protein
MAWPRVPGRDDLVAYLEVEHAKLQKHLTNIKSMYIHPHVPMHPA